MLRDNSRGAPGERDSSGVDSSQKCMDEWLSRLVSEFHDGELKLEDLAKNSIESLAGELGFRRGYFLLYGLRASGALESGRELDFEVCASRLRLEDKSDDTLSWVDVTNPDFAVNRAVARLALESRELIVFEEEVGEEGSGSSGIRPTLCRSFSMGEKKIGILYLERDFGTGLIEAGLRQSFDRFVDAFAPIYSRSCGGSDVEPAAADAPTVPAAPAVAESPSQEPVEATAASTAEAGDSPDESYYGIIGRDEKMRKIFEIIEKVKDSNLNICICGESGTGKELVARAIHQAGNRGQRDFVSENCGAISETLLESELFGHVKGAFTGADEDRQGLFAAADKGVLFLDEIGDMSENMQRKLLRTLQEGLVRPIGGRDSFAVDTRVICASNTDLKLLVGKGVFRADLFYRLNVISIDLPPLRQRRSDIPLLVKHFLDTISREEGFRRRFSSSALKALVDYSWPGNVRELSNVLRKVLLTSADKEIARKDLTPFLSAAAPGTACLGDGIEKDTDHLVLRIPLRESFNEIIDECERLVLLNALTEGGWNKSRVTRALSIPRQSLYNKIAKYDLERPSSGDASQGSAEA
ncbi:MAG: sigma-54 dependent transcriptional regulator [Planctomycetota bacterium]|nr:sigma-54 dependent transcriptional regulator [Planctomycetota bacterium]